MAMATSSVEANKRRSDELYDETNKGNLDFMDEILAPDFTSYGGAGFQDLHGPGEFKELTRTFLKSLPDLWFQVDELIGEGDDILVSGTLSGTHKGEWYGIPPIGQEDHLDRLRHLPLPRRPDHRPLAGVRRAGDHGPDAAAAAAPACPALSDPIRGPADPRPIRRSVRGGHRDHCRESKAIFHRVIEEVWNQQKLDVADELFSADHESPSAPGLPPGPAGVKMIAGMFLAAFPDLKVDIEIEIAEDDMVGGRLRQTGTHTGDMVSPAGTIAATRQAGGLHRGRDAPDPRRQGRHELVLDRHDRAADPGRRDGRTARRPRLTRQVPGREDSPWRRSSSITWA